MYSIKEKDMNNFKVVKLSSSPGFVRNPHKFIGSTGDSLPAAVPKKILKRERTVLGDRLILVALVGMMRTCRHSRCSAAWPP